MHQYRSKSPIIWIRLASFFYCLLLLSAVGFVIFTFYAVLHSSQEMMLRLLYAIGLLFCCWILYLYCGLMCKCPLCRSTPMLPKDCAKHSFARKFLGIYRLRVAATVLLRNRYRCPYCGESTHCSVRPNPKR